MPLSTTRWMRRPIQMALCFVVALCWACGSSTHAHAPALTPPTEGSVLGAGDIFSMQGVGETDLPSEYQVASDGTVDLPYVHNLKVADLEAQEVGRLVRERLIADKVLTDPSVVV